MPILEQKEKFKRFISEVWESLKFGEAKYGPDTFRNSTDEEMFEGITHNLHKYMNERRWKGYLLAAVGYIFLMGVRDKKWK